ncbi:hypothetical protein CBR_g34048 [Chara braunii]|uniref:U5 small nuclear ribonucleoprotein TSSC4 n=1 Tax=Chara braunii TaxID=69332 RepID=A0A388LHR1_CHABU|nr:hypothetical protein CBR_g34048 [Chara braunii]|eukprot:GBG81864.1 hypothetical protein CBR_g34048 [Chara braunii]
MVVVWCEFATRMCSSGHDDDIVKGAASEGRGTAGRPRGGERETRIGDGFEMSFWNDGGGRSSVTQQFNDRVAKLFGVLENSSTLQGMKAAVGEDGAKEATTRAEDIDRGGGGAENPPPPAFTQQHSSKWLVSGSVARRRTVREECDEDPDDDQYICRHRPLDDDDHDDDDDGAEDGDDDGGGEDGADDDGGAKGDGGYVFRRRKRGVECSGDVENEGDDDKEDEEGRMRAMMGRDRTLDFEEEEDEYDKYATGRQDGDHAGFWLTRTKQICDGREQFAGRGNSLWIDAIAPLPTTLAELKNSRRDMRADASAAAARLEEDDKEMEELELQLREESRREENRQSRKEKGEVEGMHDEQEEEAVAMEDEEADNKVVVKMAGFASWVGEENKEMEKKEVEWREESKMEVNEAGEKEGERQSSDGSGEKCEEMAQDEMKNAADEEAKEGGRDAAMTECSTGGNIHREVKCMATGEEGVTRGVGETMGPLVGQTRGMELSGRAISNDAEGMDKEEIGGGRTMEIPTAVAEIQTAQAATAMVGGERTDEGQTCPRDGDTDGVLGHSGGKSAEECNGEGMKKKKKKRVRFLLAEEKGDGKDEDDVNLVSTGNPEEEKMKKRSRSVIVLAGEGTGCEREEVMSTARRDWMATSSSLSSSSSLPSSSASTSGSASPCHSLSCFAPPSSTGYDWRSSIKGAARRFEESLTRSMNELFSRRRRVPDHVRNPHKYTHYSLDWSDEDDEEKERKRNLSALKDARDMVSQKRSDEVKQERYRGGFAVVGGEVSGGSGGKTMPKDEQEEGSRGVFPPGSIKFVPRKVERQRTVALARTKRKTSCSQAREIDEDVRMTDCGSEECRVELEQQQQEEQQHQQQEEWVDDTKKGLCVSVAQDAMDDGKGYNKDAVCGSGGEFLPVGIAAGAVVEEIPNGEGAVDGVQIVESSSMGKEEKANIVEDLVGELRDRGRPKSRSSRNYRSRKSAEEDGIDDGRS